MVLYEYIIFIFISTLFWSHLEPHFSLEVFRDRCLLFILSKSFDITQIFFQNALKTLFSSSYAFWDIYNKGNNMKLLVKMIKIYDPRFARFYFVVFYLSAQQFVN